MTLQVVTPGAFVESVITAAFEEYHRNLKGFAMAAVRDDDVADDIVQETFLRLVREVRAGRAPENVGAWLFRVASNVITSRGRRRTVADRARAFLVDRDVSKSAETVVVGREDDAELLDALSRLPDEARVALLLAGQGLTSAEIGASIGRSTAATRTYLCRMRLRLREELHEPRGALR